MAFLEAAGTRAVVATPHDEADNESGRRLGFDDSGRGGSPEVVFIYTKARDLAVTLGHSTIELTHILLAYTLTTDGLSRLAEKSVDASIVRRNCWMALSIHPSQPDARSPITFSGEVRAVNAGASELAKKNDRNARSVQVSQVLTVLLEDKFRDQVGPLLSAVRPAPTLEEIRANVEAVKHNLDGLLPIASESTAALGALLKDVCGTAGSEVFGTAPVSSLRDTVQTKSDRLKSG